jgi:hypothetical protein
VNLTGELKGDTIRVSRIEMPTPQVRHHHVGDGGEGKTSGNSAIFRGF